MNIERSTFNVEHRTKNENRSGMIYQADYDYDYDYEYECYKKDNII